VSLTLRFLLYDLTGRTPEPHPIGSWNAGHSAAENISPELKIANGSRGVIVALYTSKEGFHTSADGAIVHFPGSPIHLSDLPPGCIYLEPHKISYRISSGKSSKGFKRTQLQIEPAYAVTGHYSQGKTLPFVLTDLKQGGHAAYVAASRPTASTGLFLMERVTLRDLNSPPLPADLLTELRRLDALKHNTLVRHGFLQPEEVSLPDPERDMGIDDLKERVTFAVTAEQDSTSVQRKPVSIPSHVGLSCRFCVAYSPLPHCSILRFSQLKPLSPMHSRTHSHSFIGIVMITLVGMTPCRRLCSAYRASLVSM
jgi:hypothetical protein